MTILRGFWPSWSSFLVSILAGWYFLAVTGGLPALADWASPSGSAAAAHASRNGSECRCHQGPKEAMKCSCHQGSGEQRLRCHSAQSANASEAEENAGSTVSSAHQCNHSRGEARYLQVKVEPHLVPAVRLSWEGTTQAIPGGRPAVFVSVVPGVPEKIPISLPV